MLVLAGKNDIAVNALRYAIKSFKSDIAVVCNKNDVGINGWQKSLRKAAQELGIKEISLEEAYISASIFISIEFDKIIKIEKFVKGRAYNIHFSLLPKYKGMYTSIWPLLNNEKFSGTTLHEIDNGIDTGAIIDQNIFAINENDRARDLYYKYLKYGFELFSRNFNDLLTGEVKSTPQPKIDSSYYSRRSIDFSNIEIDLNQTAFNIVRQIYGFSFREYQVPKTRGQSVVEAKILNSRSFRKPGIVLAETDDYFEVATIDYDLRIYFDGIDRIKEFSSCSVERARNLLNRLCGVHDRDCSGCSPIIIAASQGNLDVIKFLLENGANIFDEDYQGNTVLMYAKDFATRTKDEGIEFFIKEALAKL